MKTNTANQTTGAKTIFSSSYKNRREATEAQKTTLAEKRQYLSRLSKPLKKRVESGEIQTINEGLKKHYAKKGHTELKTIKEWNQLGFNVNKGEHALLLWGSKKSALPKDTQTSADPYKFNPLCFVFSLKQVSAKAAK